jgi:hypothetical protein
MRAWEMSVRRYSGLLVTSGVIIAGGYGIMLLVTPSDEQIKKVPQLQGNLRRECLLKCGGNSMHRNKSEWRGRRSCTSI